MYAYKYYINLMYFRLYEFLALTLKIFIFSKISSRQPWTCRYLSRVPPLRVPLAPPAVPRAALAVPPHLWPRWFPWPPCRQSSSLPVLARTPPACTRPSSCRPGLRCTPTLPSPPRRRGIYPSYPSRSQRWQSIPRRPSRTSPRTGECRWALRASSWRRGGRMGWGVW